MSKFENKKTEHEEIEKLKQQQLIKSVLNRKNLENEALIQAIQESKNKATEDIEKRKEEIIRAKLDEEKQKNQKEINQKLEEIKSKEQEAKKIAQKSEETEKRRKNIDKSEREAFRKKIQEREAKQATVYQIGELYKREEKRNARKLGYGGTKENRNIQEASSSKENNIQKLDFSKKENRSTEEVGKLNRKEKGTLKSIKEQLINFLKGNIEKKEITNYKIIKGIKRYEEHIRLYNQYCREKLAYKRYKTKETKPKTVTNNFKDIYNKISIDHDLAIRNARKNKKGKSTQNERVS